MKIIDIGGEFVRNECPFVLVDPTNQIRYEPSEVIQINRTDWAKGQPSLVIVVFDVTAADPEVVAITKEVEVPVIAEVVTEVPPEEIPKV